MPMKNPPHPGHSVKDACLDPLSLSVTQGVGCGAPYPFARPEWTGRDIARNGHRIRKGRVVER